MGADVLSHVGGEGRGGGGVVVGPIESGWTSTLLPEPTIAKTQSNYTASVEEKFEHSVFLINLQDLIKIDPIKFRELTTWFFVIWRQMLPLTWCFVTVSCRPNRTWCQLKLKWVLLLIYFTGNWVIHKVIVNENSLTYTAINDSSFVCMCYRACMFEVQACC